ncbi:uncharacterized protein LOC115288457 isoform X3 [Suricata suricatta]|uniref:uncharacterized protein LOC115288457 isoform X3 n=1 Tax=Suricata suricatta TaxID=37032 RepID=UPI0011558601|nr:uncharacterized protein LOC115288457 isoform X3 [Suricata suricatta]
MSPSVSVAIAAVTLAEVEDQTHFTRRKSGTGAVRVWGPGHSPRIHSLSWQVQGPSEELLRHARPGVQSASLRARDPGRGHVGETVIASLGSRPLGPWRSQRVSGWLAAVLQPRPGGKPILVAGTRGPYSQHLRALPHGSSLQIRPWRLQDSGPCRARITLHTCPVNTTKDFTLRVYDSYLSPERTEASCGLTVFGTPGSSQRLSPLTGLCLPARGSYSLWTPAPPLLCERTFPDPGSTRGTGHHCATQLSFIQLIGTALLFKE